MHHRDGYWIRNNPELATSNRGGRDYHRCGHVSREEILTLAQPGTIGRVRGFGRNIPEAPFSVWSTA